MSFTFLLHGLLVLVATDRENLFSLAFSAAASPGLWKSAQAFKTRAEGISMDTGLAHAGHCGSHAGFSPSLI